MKTKIIEAIRKNSNSIPFDKFMEMALYDPEHGYYTKSKTKVGKSGDFYTSVVVSPIFGEVIADKIQTESEKHNIPITICELGAGTGMLAKSIFSKLDDKIERYIAIERSPFHQKLIREHAPKVEILNSIDELDEFTGIIISNEFFDALPTKVAQFNHGEWHEVCVTEKDNELEFIHKTATGDCLKFINRIELEAIENRRIEVPLEMIRVYENIAHKLKQGTIISIDYGVRNHEIRMNGSIRGFENHHIVEDVLDAPGEIDITYNVLFDALAKSGEKYGLETVQISKQNEFLIENGILELLEEHKDSNPFSEKSRRNRAIIQFISSESFSNYFYVLEQRKF